MHCKGERGREGGRSIYHLHGSYHAADQCVLGPCYNFTLCKEVRNGLVSIECSGDGAVARVYALRISVVEGKSCEHVPLHAPLLFCQPRCHLLTLRGIKHQVIHIFVCVCECVSACVGVCCQQGYCINRPISSVTCPV